MGTVRFALLFVTFVLVAAATRGQVAAQPPPSSRASCVAAQCCHATSCTNTTPPDCTATLCPSSCQLGTVDCGAGRCGYNAAGTCGVIWENATTTTAAPSNGSCTAGPVGASTECVPAECCHPTSCVPRSMAPNCAAVSCSSGCDANTMDCGGGVCRCHPTAGCYVEWATTTAAPTIPAPPTTCSASEGCVPAECCHATSCTSRANAPDCTATSCTARCEAGTMDCGAGVCRCGLTGCYVEWATTSAAPAACAATTDCVAAQCCHPTSCTSRANAPDCTATLCTRDCEAGTMDCGHGSCVCDASGGCRVQWAMSSPPSSGGGAQCAIASDCVPNDCCSATECVPRALGPDCSAVRCLAVCVPHTIGCGDGRCDCSATGQCGVLWTSSRPPGTLPGAAGGVSTLRAVLLVCLLILWSQVDVGGL